MTEPERGSADGEGAVTRETPSVGHETAQLDYGGVLLKPPKVRDRQIPDARCRLEGYDIGAQALVRAHSRGRL